MDPDPPELRTETGATPPPPAFVAVLWVGAFSVILWGMFLLFGRLGRHGDHTDDTRGGTPPPSS
jgi:hypothetical protein